MKNTESLFSVSLSLKILTTCIEHKVKKKGHKIYLNLLLLSQLSTLT